VVDRHRHNRPQPVVETFFFIPEKKKNKQKKKVWGFNGLMCQKYFCSWEAILQNPGSIPCTWPAGLD
jgi:hypothetical protein